MKKIALFIFIIPFLFQSCYFSKSLKLSMSAEEEYKNQCQDFILDNRNQIYIVGKLNGITDTLFFDTGCTGSGITRLCFGDTTKMENVYKRKINIPGDKVVFNVHLDTFHLETDIVNYEHGLETGILYPSDQFLCADVSKFSKPLIESGLILSYSNICLLNFSRQQICLLDSLPQDIHTYIKLKSKFEFTSTYIYLTINGVERKFIFDTGSSFGLVISEKDPEKNRQENDFMLDGSMGMNINGYLHSTDTTHVKSKYVYLIPNLSVFVNDVSYIPAFTRNNAGIRFISQYDWIIDKKNKNVYAKPIQNIESKYIPISIDDYNMYKTGVQDGQLKIILRNLSKQPVYPLYAVIKSVNGTEITQDNMCDYIELLNQTKNWDTFDIEFVMESQTQSEKKKKLKN